MPLLSRRWFTSLLLLLFALLPLAVTAQKPFSVRESYTKQDVLIPMRDGTRLYTVIFAPKDTARPYPILMERTPYSVPYGTNFPFTLGPSEKFAKEGFIVVYQDVRGTYMSEGDYVNVRPQLKGKGGPRDFDESTDTYDTIAWLVKNVPNNNGRVGMWGISYPGFYAAAGAINAHPALKAVSPQAPIADWFLGDDDHHNGAFYLMDNFAWDFNSSFDYPRPKLTQNLPSTGMRYNSDDAYTFYLKLGSLKNANLRYFKNKIPFWNELMEHGTYDAYWQARCLLPHLQNIKPAMLVVGGLFDAEDLYGPLHIYKTIAKTSPSTPNYFAFGPWPHGGWAGGNGSAFGDLAFHENTGVYYRENIEFPFFNYYLKGIGSPPAHKAQVFTTGSNKWQTFDAWPPKNAKPLAFYFQEQHALSSIPTGKGVDNPTQGSDSFVSDPAKPVPYTDLPGIGRRNEYMINDQRFAAKRPDVLTYATSPLNEDLTVYGPITADLFVSTTGTDADWVVKVIDVYPEDAPMSESASGNKAMGNYQMLVRGDVMRGKFRNSFEKPEPFTPGKVAHVKFDLQDVCHTFRKGHRIMVQVQSSWFPLVDRNPQKFCDIASSDESDFQKATHSLHRAKQFPSRIVFQTLPDTGKP